ncbi:Hypothetical protein, putative, partial [Bodo saltans]
MSSLCKLAAVEGGQTGGFSVASGLMRYWAFLYSFVNWYLVHTPYEPVHSAIRLQRLLGGKMGFCHNVLHSVLHSVFQGK